MRKMALLGSVCLLALPTMAWADGMVTRHEDGSIEVKSDVGDTVVFPKGTLGSLIEDAWAKGGAKPFAGVTTAVVTLNAGPRGAISGGLLPWQAAWEELARRGVALRAYPAPSSRWCSSLSTIWPR